MVVAALHRDPSLLLLIEAPRMGNFNRARRKNPVYGPDAEGGGRRQTPRKGANPLRES